MFDLSLEFRSKYLEEMVIVSEAVKNAFGAEKMNYECLENGDAHLHWHLFPRVPGDIDGYGNNGRSGSGNYLKGKNYRRSFICTG